MDGDDLGIRPWNRAESSVDIYFVTFGQGFQLQLACNYGNTNVVVIGAHILNSPWQHWEPAFPWFSYGSVGKEGSFMILLLHSSRKFALLSLLFSGAWVCSHDGLLMTLITNFLLDKVQLNFIK
jgi:hypothetical protein